MGDGLLDLLEDFVRFQGSQTRSHLIASELLQYENLAPEEKRRVLAVISQVLPRCLVCPKLRQCLTKLARKVGEKPTFLNALKNISLRPSKLCVIALEIYVACPGEVTDIGFLLQELGHVDHLSLIWQQKALNALKRLWKDPAGAKQGQQFILNHEDAPAAVIRTVPPSPDFAGHYIKCVLERKSEMSAAYLQAWSFAAKQFVTAEIFEQRIFPALTRMLKRQPECAIRSVCFLFQELPMDLSPFLKDLATTCVELFKGQRKEEAQVMLRHVARKVRALESVNAVLEAWTQVLSNAKTNALEKNSILHALLITLECINAIKELPKGLMDAIIKEVSVQADKALPIAVAARAAHSIAQVPPALLDAFVKIVADKKDTYKPDVVKALLALDVPQNWLEKQLVPLTTAASSKAGLRHLSINAWLVCAKAKLPMKKEQIAVLKDSKSFVNATALIAKAPFAELISQADLLKELLLVTKWDPPTRTENDLVDFTLGSNDPLCRAIVATKVAIHDRNTIPREEAPHESEPSRTAIYLDLHEILRSMAVVDAENAAHEILLSLWHFVPFAIEEKYNIAALRAAAVEIVKGLSQFLSLRGVGICIVLMQHEVFSSKKWPAGRVWRSMRIKVAGTENYVKNIILETMKEPMGEGKKVYRGACLMATGSIAATPAADDIIGACLQMLTDGAANVSRDSATNAVHFFFAPEGRHWVPEGTYSAREVESKNVKVDKFQRELYGEDAVKARPKSSQPKAKPKSKNKAAPSFDQGNLTQAEIVQVHIQEQSEKRAKMRAYIDTVDFALDIIGVLGERKQTEKLTRWAALLMPTFEELIKSPLTTLRTRYRLRPFVSCVVSKSAIGSRALIPDVLQTFSQRGPEEGAGMACTLLTSISPLEPLNAAGLSLLTPIIVNTLRTASPALQPACQLCLDVLINQLPLIYREHLDLLTSKIRLDLLEGVFCVLFRLPQLLLQAITCLGFLNTHLVCSVEEVERLSHFYLQLDLKARKAMLPTLKNLLENAAYDPRWGQILHHVLLLSKVEEPKAKELLEVFNLEPSVDVFTGILKIFKRDVLTPNKEVTEIQLLAAKALAELVTTMADSSFTKKVLDTLHAEFLNVEEHRGIAVSFDQLFRIEACAEFAQTNLIYLLQSGLTKARDVEERDLLISSGLGLLEYHGEKYNVLLLEVLESFDVTAKKFTENQQLGSAVFFGGLAKHLDSGDPKVSSILPRLLDRLQDPHATTSVQLAIVKVLPPLVKQATGTHERVITELLRTALSHKNETTRRGAAFGLGAAVKGVSVQALKQYQIMHTIEEAVGNKGGDATERQGAIMCIEGLTRSLGRLFEPYVIQTLPTLLQAYSDSSEIVRKATMSASSSIMAQLSGHGVKLILPSLLKGVEEQQWRTKLASIELLASMVNCAPKQLAACLPTVVPALSNVVNDMHAKVKEAARDALEKVASVITNPEIKSLSKDLLLAIQFTSDDQLKKVLDALLNTSFVHNVDAPSLALVCPIAQRALKDRSAETKRKGAQIVGSMILLIKEPKDIAPYLPALLPAMKQTLIDPIPDVRSTTAKALGTVAQGLPEEYLDDLIPWLFNTLKSKESEVERSGAAHGLSEVLMAIGLDRIEQYLPDIINTATRRDAPPEVKEGYLGLFVYLPATLGAKHFEPYFNRVLQALIQALADDTQSVRDIAFRAASGLARQFGASHTALMLPPLEEGIFSAEWQVRHGCVQLLGGLIEQIFKATRMNLNSGDLMSCEVLPHERRAFMLSSLYIVRSDWNATVRQSAISVWKQVVQNTPRTLKELLPILMSRLISNLASPAKEKQVVAARCVGDLVGKLADRVMPELMPSFMKNLQAGDTNTREGVCIGLTEVINSTTKALLVEYINELVPAVQQALLDEVASIRNAASGVIALLSQKIGPSATRPIVMWILEGLAGTDKSFIEGLEQLLAKQPQMVLPIVLEHLPAQGPDWTENQLLGFGALSNVPDHHAMHRHLSDIIPPLLQALGGERRETALLAASHIMKKVDEGGTNMLLAELTTSLRSSEPAEREGAATLFTCYFENAPEDLVHVLATALPALIPAALSDPDLVVLRAAVTALSTLTKACGKDDLAPYLPMVRQLVLEQSMDRTRTEIKGLILPGLAQANGLDPLHPIYQHGLMFGSSEMRVEAAMALGELVDHTTEEALKPYVVKITGPLIRIVGDRFSSEIKSAIADTLRLLLNKGGAALRPFLPQLQTTYNKCLNDPDEGVRTKAAESLGTLVQLSKGNRVEPLLADLCLGSDIETVKAQEDKPGVRRANLLALQNILENIPGPIAEATAEKVWAACKTSAFSSDHGEQTEDVRESAARCLGVLMRFNKDLAGELKPYLSAAETPENRHAAVVAFANSSSECFELSVIMPFIGQDEPIKNWAVGALGTVPSSESAKKLTSGLALWKSERTLIAALTAVGSQDPKHSSALVQQAAQFLTHANPKVKAAAEKGLAQILRVDDEDPGAVLKSLNVDNAAAIRAAVIKKK
eukprot:GEMP01000197.1.p1 GENE.GEMP01000197.1~~GEMP01000197.1.p1  ORF type:complete len:2522 (+),score=547.28 GEMP01000197.1:66-7568(+)